jgi:hypothetical protein
MHAIKFNVLSTNVAKNVESEAATELVSSLKHALDSRIIAVRDNDLLNVAMLLDPRFAYEAKLKTESARVEIYREKIVHFYKKRLTKIS